LKKLIFSLSRIIVSGTQNRGLYIHKIPAKFDILLKLSGQLICMLNLLMV